MRSNGAILSLVLVACAPAPRAMVHREDQPSIASTPLAPSANAAASAIPSATTSASASPLPTNGPIHLVAVGDVMLARSIGTRLVNDPQRSPFGGVVDVLRGADVAVANLECAMGSGGVATKKAYTFLAPPVAANALADAGIDIVNLANNHIMDFGADVFAETLALLDRAHVAHAGGAASEERAHTATVVDVRGLKLGFLGYVKVMAEGKGGAGFDTRSWEAKGATPGIAWADPGRIAIDVAAAKRDVDVVIVMLHSGYEASPLPNLWQMQAARAAVDAGAMLVLGAHPHVLQGAERYKGGFIAYSLGNFVFDGGKGFSAILDVTLDRDGVKDVAWTPVILRDGYPEKADAKTTTLVNSVIQTLSAQIGEARKQP